MTVLEEFLDSRTFVVLACDLIIQHDQLTRGQKREEKKNDEQVTCGTWLPQFSIDSTSV